MARPNNARVPAISVEDEIIKKRLDLPAALDAELSAYGAYFESVTGKKPKSDDAVIVGILSDYLAGDSGFQAWRKAATKAPAGKAASPTVTQPKGDHNANPAP
jgi:hypothetical protein